MRIWLQMPSQAIRDESRSSTQRSRMTIREHLNRRLFRGQIVAGWSWVMFAANLFSADESSVFIFLPFIVFGGAVFYLLYFIKCPKCGATIGRVMERSNHANYCPGCGVNFDSPL